MVLADKIRIARRFQKSIRIDTDLGEKNALEGFICPTSSTDILLSMARQVSDTGQGAFTWTGPYGSGKSSLVIALSALLNGNTELQKKAKTVFGQEVTDVMRNLLPTGSKGWHILPVVGSRNDPVAVVGKALKDSGYVTRRPKGGWTQENVINSLMDIAMNAPKTHGGLILFVDEMGKFLEAAAQDISDVYFFQQIAEAASRSSGRLIFIGILHQAFDEYAHRLSHELRDEWAKIQGRFTDLPINTIGDEQIDLISRAIESDQVKQNSKDQCQTVSKLVRKDRLHNADRLADMLTKCWPLHPVVVCLLGPISRRRFGQNQRSIFGFLNSSEPYGFQDYLKSADESDLYTPSKFWNYLRANLEPSILASPDGHRWAMAAEAVDRCEALGGEGILVALLKTIALIDLFKERSGLVPNFELLRTCFPEVSKKSLKEYLDTLDKWSLTIFKKFQGAHAIFAGSDFNIEEAVGTALADIDEIDFEALMSLAGLQPILAKRHYHETGAMRWFDVNITPAKDVISKASQFRPKNGAIGEFILVIPTNGEEESQIKTLCRDAAKLSDKFDIIAGYSPRAWSVAMLARELLALNKVSNDHPELAGDKVARREVTARLADLQAQLETELSKSFGNAEWCQKQYPTKQYRQSDLNSLASKLAEKRFDKCPHLNNELLNRQKPSSSAIAAQNSLLKHMITKDGVDRLGIHGFPAEGGLYSSLLEATGLYAKTNKGWKYLSPLENKNDSCRLAPAWSAAIEYIKKNKNRTVCISELNVLWGKPPYGIKEGLMPILSVAFILTQRQNLAVYREGIFRSHFEEIDVELLSKDATMIQVRWMKLSKLSRNLLSEMSNLVRELDERSELIHLEPIDVARGLIGIYEQLPNWTKRTMHLSARAIQIREIYKRANDPNKFLFEDIPALMGINQTDISNRADIEKIASIVKEGTEELVHAFPLMINRLKDMVLAELQVPNLSRQSLLELTERAENTKGLSGDFRLEAFISRISQFNGDDASFESIASLAANKPPRDWVDTDLDRSSLELMEMARKFLKAETFTRIKGRPEKSLAVAVLVGKEGHTAPLLEEFSIIDSDRATINSLIDSMTQALDSSDIKKRSIILAALTELTASYMQDTNPIGRELRNGQTV